VKKNERRIDIWLVIHGIKTNDISWFDINIEFKGKINGWKTWLVIQKMKANDVNYYKELD
jgi:hypothetical protein